MHSLCTSVKTSSKTSLISHPVLVTIMSLREVCVRCKHVSFISDGYLVRCRRSARPTPPTCPPYKFGLSKAEQLKEWQEEKQQRKAAPARPPCSNPEKICKDCVLERGCFACVEWECEACQLDKETPKLFQRYQEEAPEEVLGIFADEYGRRGGSAQCALDLRTCFSCEEKFCCGCAERCSAAVPVSSLLEESSSTGGSTAMEFKQCENVCCVDCEQEGRKAGELAMKTTGCEGCQGVMDGCDDFEIGPVDRSRWCRSTGWDNFHGCCITHKHVARVMKSS